MLGMKKSFTDVVKKPPFSSNSCGCLRGKWAVFGVDGGKVVETDFNSPKYDAWVSKLTC